MKYNATNKHIIWNRARLLITSILLALFFSYSVSVHFLDWYAKAVYSKVILILCILGLSGWVIYQFLQWFIPQIQECSCAIAKALRLLSIPLLLILGVYYYFYYDPVPFLTTHKLEVGNVSENIPNDDNSWIPIEITGISYLNGNSLPLDNLTIEGDRWITEDSILLKPGSIATFQGNFIGALELNFRTDADQGIVSVNWDGQTQIVDLSTNYSSQKTITLSASSWGTPSLLWGCLAVLSVLSDFLIMVVSILILTVFFLNNYFSTKTETKDPGLGQKVNWVDLLITLCLFSFSLILTKNVFGGHFSDYTKLSGDAGNYASFAAAKTYPELFENDPLLNDLDNFDVYSTYHAYLTKALAPLLGNFGSAFMVLQLPLTFMQLFGFYLLGRELYRSRLFGVFLTCFAFIFTQMNLSEFWGYVTSPIPRLSFQAILPFILFLVLKWGSNVKKWPAIMALTAISAYIHLVSAPAWSIAIVVSLWFMAPRTVHKSQKIKYMGIALMIFVILLSPLVVRYFQKTSFGEQDIYSIEGIYAIIDYRLAEGMVDFKLAVQDFFNNVLLKSWIPGSLFCVGLISIAIMNYVTRKNAEKSRKVVVVSLWVAGIIIVSILFPMIDFAVARVLDKNPIQIQFLRAMRNFFPLLYILFLWPFAYVFNTVQKKGWISKGLCLIVVLLSGFSILQWGIYNEFIETPVMARTLNCWAEGKIICPEDEELAVRADFFAAIKEQTPEGSRILSDDLAVRYYSLRPLAFSKKDGATFSFSNHQALLEWYEYALLYDELWYLRDDRDAYLDAYTDFAEIVDADYVVLEEPYSEQAYYPENLILSYSNQGFSLFAVGD